MEGCFLNLKSEILNKSPGVRMCPQPMMQCPQCHRSYAEDFSFCLDDGTRLVDPRALEKTLILPTPQQSAPTEITPAPATVGGPSPVASTAVASAPAKTAVPASRSSAVKIVLVTFGLIAVVLVWGMIKVGLWWLDQSHRPVNQNANVAPSTVAVDASPDPTPNPTPSVDLRNLVGPQSSPSPETETKPGSIPTGTYLCELTKGLGEVGKQGASIKLQITFNGDGTYFQQGFISMPAAGIKDQLAMEEKGRYSQTGDTLILSNRLKRELMFGDSNWAVPTDGTESKEKMRMVNATTFQIFDTDQKQWFTFTRM